MSSTTFTVFYDGQFWVGLLEVIDNGELRVARHVFGSEPSGPELYEFALRDYGALSALAHRSPTVPVDQRRAAQRPVNPKRLARQVAKERAQPAVSTVAQEAVKQTISENASARKSRRKELRDTAEHTRRQIARAKAKARHRGKA
ncbi:YjdF family protein [Rhodococcus sp. NPDC055112]